MASREIEIVISPDGRVIGNISGIKGPGCRQLANLLAEVIGTEVSFTPSAEYYETEVREDLDVNT